jgi:hypothetical protein
MKKKLTSVLGIFIAVLATSISLSAQNKPKPIVLEAQGSFTVGGIKITEPGNFDLNNALKPQGQTFHGDHAYVFYQIPVKARKYPLVFLHGAGESKKSWETTFDGREGFQNIFLRRDFSVYLQQQLLQRLMNNSGLHNSGSVIIPIIFRTFSFQRILLPWNSFSEK